MAWERRTRGGLYYTRSRRVGGRVVREYIGCGEVARAIARLDALEREEREAERAEREQERVETTAAMQAMAVLVDALEELVEAVLTANGYHQHRGQWRSRRTHGAGQKTELPAGDAA